MRVDFVKPDMFGANQLERKKRYLRDLHTAVKNNTFYWNYETLEFPDAENPERPWYLLRVRMMESRPDAQATQALVTLALFQRQEVMP
jgi:hypothetical protein